MKNDKDFDPSKIELVNINDVRPNDYNPKEKNTAEYRNVVKSIGRNGLKQFIFVREVDGEMVIVDGEQRWTAAKELGYSQIYVYNLGAISEEEAKALTIWFEVQVPLDEVDLAPIALELHKVGIDLPFTEKEMGNFENLAKFSFDDYSDDGVLEDGDLGFKTLKIQMLKSQFDGVRAKINEIVELEGVSEGRALELLVADGLAGYEFEEENESDS